MHQHSPNLKMSQDMAFQSITSILKPFALKPEVIMETGKEQQECMFEVVANKVHQGWTILLISQGGPVTHLYEKPSGNHWNAQGESKYCHYSICECESQDDLLEVWKTMVVNESKCQDDLWLDGTANM